MKDQDPNTNERIVAFGWIIFGMMMTIQRKWGLLINLSIKRWGYYALLGLLNPVAYYLVLFSSFNFAYPS